MGKRKDKKGADEKTKIRGFVNKIIAKLVFRWRHNASMRLFCASEIAELCYRTRELIWSEPLCLELKTPLCVVGDIHGQFDDLLGMFDLHGWPLCEREFRWFSEQTRKFEKSLISTGVPAKKPAAHPTTTTPRKRRAAGADAKTELDSSFKRYLFLGDYVDRGPYSMEVVMLLSAIKLAYPDRIFMLRGNHESRSVNCHYGFYKEITHRYDPQVYECFQNLFNVLPFCAVIEGSIMCMHGGISSHLKDFGQFSAFKRPLEVADVGILADLTWADPDPSVDGFQPSPRGASYVFGPNALRSFLKRMNLRMVIRAHQVVEDGYEFFDDRRLVTIFSAPNYCGQNDNTAAMISIDKNMQISIKVFRPYKKDKRGYERERQMKEKEKGKEVTKVTKEKKK